MAAIVGTVLSSVTVTLGLPSTRVDGSTAQLSEILSYTILRDPGTGPVPLTVQTGPFTAQSQSFVDPSPATGSDIYSFYATDSSGQNGVTSAGATVTIAAPSLAQLSAGTISAALTSSGTPPTTLTISPTTATVVVNGTQSFTASDPTATFSAVSGVITAAGVYTAPSTAGNDTVAAQVGSQTATAAVTVTAASSLFKTP